MKRINVVGVSGSGKSTFSKALAEAMGIPCIEMDSLYWQPDWQEPDDESFFATVKQALEGDAWVLDGNYSRTTPIKWGRADTVIWLDYSYARTFFQILMRSIKRARDKNELWAGTGNTESFYRSFFHRDSVIWWMLTSYGRVRKGYQRAMASDRSAHLRFIHVTSPAQAQAIVESARAGRL